MLVLGGFAIDRERRSGVVLLYNGGPGHESGLFGIADLKTSWRWVEMGRFDDQRLELGRMKLRRSPNHRQTTDPHRLFSIRCRPRPRFKVRMYKVALQDNTPLQTKLAADFSEEVQYRIGNNC